MYIYTSFTTTKWSEGSFKRVYIVRDTDRDPVRSSPAQHGPTHKSFKILWSKKIFFSSSNALKFCTLIDKALIFTFFVSCKEAKLFSSYYLTRFPIIFRVEISKHFYELWNLDTSYLHYLQLYRYQLCLFINLFINPHTSCSNFEEYSQMVW